MNRLLDIRLHHIIFVLIVRLPYIREIKISSFAYEDDFAEVSVEGKEAHKPSRETFILFPSNPVSFTFMGKTAEIRWYFLRSVDARFILIRLQLLASL